MSAPLIDQFLIPNQNQIVFLKIGQFLLNITVSGKLWHPQEILDSNRMAFNQWKVLLISVSACSLLICLNLSIYV